MVRRSKTARDRHVSYKRPRLPGKKETPEAPQKRSVPANGLSAEHARTAFIPKIS